jgi:hypothetical protein
VTVVVVPVLGRPGRARPLADSLAATSDARLVFVCSPNDRDQIIACNATGADVLVTTWEPGPGDFARKTNLAYRKTTEPWILCGADDLVFHRNWEQEALIVGERTGAGVVGTQDRHNPEVKRGRHSTHPLVRRSYIAKQGGTFDGTGDIYCELFDHQYVDNELIWTAKQRGQWAFAHRSIVEHLHPTWGDAEMDATYEKALRATDADRKLFLQRMRRIQTLEARRKRR